MRRTTKCVMIKDVAIGGDNPVVIQSMTNIKTEKITDVVEQINKLAKAGAELVRIAIMDEADAKALPAILQQVSIPLVGDIHFDYRLAILAVQNGISKIRINPGNIGGKENTLKVIEECRKHNVPIRIGVNSGSIESEFKPEFCDTPQKKADAMIASLKKYLNIFEEAKFTQLVLSLKATDLETTIIANQKAAEQFCYPLHIGLTEAGTITSGVIRSSYVLGTLLKEGIGDTIRVSLTGDPLQEIPVCKEILAMFDLYQKPTLISCPTCGRTAYPMIEIVQEMERFLYQLKSNITVAIMGCVVNGPGEASHADIGIAGGKNSAVLFKKGKIIQKLTNEEIISVLQAEILKMVN